MSALKGLGKDWDRFPKDVIDDLRDKGWKKGTTLEYKNQYRMRVVLVLSLCAVGLAFTFPIAAAVPAAVAVWKLKIIATDK